MKLGTVGVNLENVEAYRVALKGLSVEQSVFALASKGATEEQIRQILVTDQAKLKDVEAAMAKAGLTTATKALNAEELIALATQKGISAERAEEIASALGLIATEKGQVVSKKQLTVATLQQVGATDAEITAILGLNAAETANIGITNVLTASFAKLWAVITAHPIGAILTAIGVVVVGAVAAYNKWGDTLENTKEKLSDLKSECQEIVSDLQAVNSELETTQQRLEELEGKDTLTFTEKEEYDNLVKINKELQRKIDLLELEEKNKRKEQNKTFVSAMEKDTENPFEHEVNPDGKSAGQYSISDEYLTSETGYINAQFEIREQLLDDLANAETEKEKERIQKRIDEINSYLEDKNTEWKTVSDGIDYIENPTTEDDKAVNEWLDYIADFQDRMAIAMSKDDASSNAQYKTNAFNRLVDNWYFDKTVQNLQDLGEEGKVTAEMLNDPAYKEFINKLVEIGIIDSADNLDDIALAFNGVTVAAQEASGAVEEFTKIDISSEISKLDTLKDKMSTLDNAYAKLFDADVDTKIDYEDYSSIYETFSEVEGIDEYILRLQEVGQDADAVNSIMEELIGSYLSYSGILDDVNEQNADLIEQMLTEQGIKNSNALVTEALARNTEEAARQKEELALQEEFWAQASKDSNANMVEEIETFIKGKPNIEEARISLLNYALAKETSNGIILDTTEDIQALMNLVQALGGTTDALNLYNQVKGGPNGMPSELASKHDIEGTISNYKKNAIKEVQDALNKSKEKDKVEWKPQIEYEGGDATKGAISGASKEAETDWKKLLDAELNLLEKQLELGLISFDDYLNKRRDLIEDYYADGKLSAAEYYEYLEKHYENQLSYMDKVINAVTRKIDKEIDKLKDKQEEIEEHYNLQIEYLEEQKTALEEANAERQRQIDLQKALYELERAQNQRTTLMYSEEKGMHYVADGGAIRDAQQDVEDAEFEIKISEIEKAIVKLEEARDRELEAIDEMIEKLEEYKEYWEEIAHEFEYQQEEMIAAQILGADWEQQILDGRLDTLKKFKDEYIAIQQAILDAQYQAALALGQEAEHVKLKDSYKPQSDTDGNGKYVVIDESGEEEDCYFNTKAEAEAYRDAQNKKKAQAYGIDTTKEDWKKKWANANIPGYYIKGILEKYHAGLAKGPVNGHSYDEDLKLVQDVGLGKKEVLTVLEEQEVVATPDQVSNLASAIRGVNMPSYLTPLPSDHPLMQMAEKFNGLADGLVDALNNNNVFTKYNEEMAKAISSVSNHAVTRTQQIKQEFYVTLPNVNDSTAAITLLRDLESLGTKKLHAFNN